MLRPGMVSRQGANLTYREWVLADAPYAAWSMGDATSPLQDETAGNRDMTVVGATLDQTGPLAVGDEGAAVFDGIGDYGSVALDLSDTRAITVEFLLWWDAYANDYDMALEFTADAGSTTGGFYIAPNAGAGVVEIVHRGGSAGVNSKTFTRPSAAAWHHWACIFDFGEDGANEVRFVLDGVLQTATGGTNSDNAPTDMFANSTLYVMSRAGAALFGAGKMAWLAIYKLPLSVGRIGSHYGEVF